MKKTTINGFEVCFLPDTRFKTAGLMLYLRAPLQKDTVSSYSLLPSVLFRGTASYPETRDLNIYLEELYGASCAFQISKHGAEQVLLLRFETVADRFAQGETPFLKLVAFACDLLFYPLLENGAFRASYVEREKENLKQYIIGLANDKRKYAKDRLLAEMCKDEEYSIAESGTVEGVDAITPQSLFAAYKTLLETGKISIYITEQADQAAVTEVLQQVLPQRQAQNGNPLFPVIKPTADKVKVVEEIQPVTQGKLSMGFRTSVTRTSPEFYAMMLCNALFGGAPYAKLFCNVREKLSLAYYASSQYIANKGLVLVNSGIEFSNFEAAKSEILVQLDAMKQGDFTEKEVEFAKLDVTDALRGIRDNGASLANFYANLTAQGITESVEDVIEKLQTVTKDQIVAAANTIVLDTIYFLKGEQA